MSYTDKTIQCSDCGTSFTFSADEQEQFASRGYTNEPKRCPTCRQARKATQSGSSYNNDNSGYSTRREMFPAKCSECGKDTQVPFQPRSGRPVYCSDCFRKVKPSSR
jgi:CxxC-x17-CxxC domain-containing protein